MKRPITTGPPSQQLIRTTPEQETSPSQAEQTYRHSPPVYTIACPIDIILICLNCGRNPYEHRDKLNADAS